MHVHVLHLCDNIRAENAIMLEHAYRTMQHDGSNIILYEITIRDKHAMINFDFPQYTASIIQLALLGLSAKRDKKTTLIQI